MTRRVDTKSLKYYVIVDEGLAERSGKESLEDLVSAVLRGGATAVQLRGKEVTPRDLVSHGKRIRTLTEDAGVLLIINDRVDIALAVGADGVHLGPDDLPVKSARKICPRRFVIGASVDTPDEARQAKAAGADYLGAGPVFPTETKKTTNRPIGPDGLREIVEAVSIPVVGIGGIGPENIGEVLATGAAGAAVISSVVGAPDPERAVRALRSQAAG